MDKEKVVSSNYHVDNGVRLCSSNADSEWNYEYDNNGNATIITATLVEDVFTGGAGVVDDTASLAAACASFCLVAATLVVKRL